MKIINKVRTPMLKEVIQIPKKVNCLVLQSAMLSS
jgi:hypothetical protein